MFPATWFLKTGGKAKEQEGLQVLSKSQINTFISIFWGCCHWAEVWAKAFFSQQAAVFKFKYIFEVSLYWFRFCFKSISTKFVGKLPSFIKMLPPRILNTKQGLKEPISRVIHHADECQNLAMLVELGLKLQTEPNQILATQLIRYKP